MEATTVQTRSSPRLRLPHLPQLESPWTVALMVTFVLNGVAFTAIYGLAEGSWSVYVVSGAIGSAAVGVGGFIGFLFGIPRALTAEIAPAGGSVPERTATRYSPNTNLEQISDWLTKILVGASLVQIGKVDDALAALGGVIGPALGGSASAEAFGIAVVVYFLIGGFLVGYLFTRLHLQKQLRLAEQE